MKLRCPLNAFSCFQPFQFTFFGNEHATKDVSQLAAYPFSSAGKKKGCLCQCPLPSSYRKRSKKQKRDEDRLADEGQKGCCSGAERLRTFTFSSMVIFGLFWRQEDHYGKEGRCRQGRESNLFSKLPQLRLQRRRTKKRKRNEDEGGRMRTSTN